MPDEFEMKKIIRFVENGNDVFISAAILSEDVKSIMSFGISYVDVYHILPEELTAADEDTLKVRLTKPPFIRNQTYQYPGKRFDTYFFKIDTFVTTVSEAVVT